MRWVIVPEAGCERAARSVALDLPELGVASQPPIDTDGVVFVGTDHGLAHLTWTLPARCPVLYVPTAPSDLARMFRFDLGSVVDRLHTGSAYPTDLLEFESDATGERGRAVAHLIMSRTGRLPTWRSRSAAVRLIRAGRSDEVTAAAIVVANAQHAQGHTIAPRAAVMDGRAEVQVFAGGWMPRLRAIRAMDRGLHLRSPALTRRSFEALDVEIPPGWRARADQVVLAGRRFAIEVVPAGLTLWV